MFIELEHINHGDHSIYQYRFPVDAHADLLGMTQHSGGGYARAARTLVRGGFCCDGPQHHVGGNTRTKVLAARLR
jgi:hypothetical protein